MIDESMEPGAQVDEASGAKPRAGGTATPERSVEPAVLAPHEVTFRCEGGRLQMRRREEEQWRDVGAVRLFPLSDPNRWISIVDEQLKEVGLLLDLSALCRAERRCVEEELRRRYLTPRILRVIACRTRFDMSEWVVETDRGPATFLVRDAREKIKEPLPRHLTVIDVENNRYDIPDVEALDPASRRLLEEWL